MSALTGVAAAIRDVLAAAALGQIWITRDSDPVTGEICDEVDVWSSRPVRHQISAGEPELGIARSYMWVSGEFDISGRVAALPLAAARACFPCVPDDDRQCIVIG